MSESTLKPCPFCGGEAEVIRHGDHGRSTQIACTDCGCWVESSDVFPKHMDTWNRRAHETSVACTCAAKMVLHERTCAVVAGHPLAVTTGAPQKRINYCRCTTLHPAVKDGVGNLVCCHCGFRPALKTSGDSHGT